MFKFVISLLLVVALISPSVASFAKEKKKEKEKKEEQEVTEKKYSKLTKTEKDRLQGYRKEKIGCVQEKVLENDDGKIDPIKLARTFQGECSYMDNRFKSDITRSMLLSDKFAEGFVSAIDEELKYQLVPFILKKRREKRLGIKYPDPSVEQEKPEETQGTEKTSHE